MPTTLLVVLVLGLLAVGAVWLHAKSNVRLAQKHLDGRRSLTPAEFAAEFFPSDQALIAARLRELLAEAVDVGIDFDRLHPNDRFVKDLRIEELDSLALALFVTDIEKEFDIKLPDAELHKIRTFRQVVEVVIEQAGRPTA